MREHFWSKTVKTEKNKNPPISLLRPFLGSLCFICAYLQYAVGQNRARFCVWSRFVRKSHFSIFLFCTFVWKTNVQSLLRLFSIFLKFFFDATQLNMLYESLRRKPGLPLITTGSKWPSAQRMHPPPWPPKTRPFFASLFLPLFDPNLASKGPRLGPLLATQIGPRRAQDGSWDDFFSKTPFSTK